jgi:pimeloyl-ACP methyl ester carboxylesterase
MFKRLMQAFNASNEMPRLMADAMMFRTSFGAVKDDLPKGDGHPVLVLPGFLTDDSYTASLRDTITQQGYKVHTWGGGLNTGFDERAAEHLRQRLHDIFEESGGQKVTLVGHSLGGIFARELAREFPDQVRAVVTLGTPAGMVGKPGSSSPMLERLYEAFNPHSEHENLDLQVRGATPPPVPTTAIYSKSDGIVWWESCLNPATDHTENIEVRSGHLGMVANVPAVMALLDRLAQKEGAWKPFNASQYGASKFPPVPANDELPANPEWTAKNAKSKPLFGGPKRA